MYQDDPLQSFREERLEQKKRRPAILIGIAVGVAVAGAVGWMTFGKYVSLYGDANGELPVIRADTSLYRIRPKTPGGMEVPNQDKLIYDRLRSSEGELAVERLLPQPEKPAIPEFEEAEEKSDLPSEVKTSEDPIGALADHVSSSDELASGTVYDEHGAPVEVMFRTVAAAEKPKPAPKPEPSLEKPAPSAQKKAGPEKQKTADKQKPAERKEPEKYAIQLVSTRSEAAAEGEWKRLSKKYKDLTAGLSHFVSEVAVDKGVFYRLRAGAFETREQAKALCDKFKAQKQECIVAKQ